VTEPATPDPPPARACSACGAPQDERQEICVECGHAAEPRERWRIRRALPTASLAAFAVLLAASAAYGLTAGGAGNVSDPGLAESKKPAVPDAVASATPAPPATTSTTPVPVPPATAAPPATPPSPAKVPKATKAKPATTTPSTPSSTGSTPSGTSGGNHTSTKPSKPRHTPHHTPSAIPTWFADGDPPPDAFVYDEAGAGANEHPSQANRVNDGSTKTAWTTANHASGLNGSGVGLVVDTGQAQPYTDIGIATSTPGFKVSIYSSNDSKGSGKPSANGWKLEGKKSGVAKYQKINLKGANDQPRYLLIWITKLPPGKSFAGISEISLIL
jgi:predicted nucleic acid-binding Zn ribbon protein